MTLWEYLDVNNLFIELRGVSSLCPEYFWKEKVVWNCLIFFFKGTRRLWCVPSHILNSTPLPPWFSREWRSRKHQGRLPSSCCLWSRAPALTLQVGTTTASDKMLLRTFLFWDEDLGKEVGSDLKREDTLKWRVWMVLSLISQSFSVFRGNIISISGYQIFFYSERRKLSRIV